MPFKDPERKRAYMRAYFAQHPKKAPLSEMKPRHHGTLYGYNDYRCRCDACKTAMREYQRRYLKRRRAAQ